MQKDNSSIQISLLGKYPVNPRLFGSGIFIGISSGLSWYRRPILGRIIHQKRMVSGKKNTRLKAVGGPAQLGKLIIMMRLKDFIYWAGEHTDIHDAWDCWSFKFRV